MVHISFYVPVEFADKVKTAMFEAGGGRVGNYEHCCFESEGVGQYKPLEGSRPFLGSKNVLERVSEVKVEMACENNYLVNVINALKTAHPYETPAYYVTETLSL